MDLVNDNGEEDGFLLSEVRSPDSIYSSVVLSGKDGSRKILLQKINGIFVYAYDKNAKTLMQLEDNVLIDEPLRTIVKYSRLEFDGHDDGVFAITDSYTISLIEPEQEGSGYAFCDVVQLDTKGQKPCIDTSPLMLHLVKDGILVLIVHTFHGLIQMISITRGKDEKPRLKSKKRTKVEKENYYLLTFSIGNIVIQLMTLLENYGSSVLAILYRDFDYNYSLRFYNVNQKEMKLSLLQQFDDFEEPPSHQMAAPFGGLFIFTPLHIFYFPNPLANVELQFEIDELCLSNGSQGNFLTKVNDHSLREKLMKDNITESAVIDNQRTLLIGSDGRSYLLYVEYIFSGINTVIFNAFSFFELGWTTVANGLHNLGEGFFFASSRYSQSLLFELFSNPPFINIVQSVESSPPILDLCLSSSNPSFEILTCQGGYENGELRRIVDQKYELKELAFKELNTRGLSLVPIKSQLYENRFSVKTPDKLCTGCLEITHAGSDYTFNLEYKRQSEIVLFLDEINGMETRITNTQVIRGTQTVLEGHIESVIFLDGYMLLKCPNSIILLHEMSEICRIDLDGKKIASYDACRSSNQNILLLLTYLTGEISLSSLTVTSGDQEILYNDAENFRGAFACCLLLRKDHKRESALIFLLLINGSVIKINASLSDHISESYLILEESLAIPFQLIKGYEDKIIAFNNAQIYLLYERKGSGFLDCTRVFTRKTEVMDIKIYEGGLLVVLLNERISLCTLEDSISSFGYDVLFSNVLNSKCLRIPGTNLMIVVCLKNWVQSLEKGVERQYLLKLIDFKVMKLLNVFYFAKGDSYDVVDVCNFSNESKNEESASSFIVLTNCPKADELFILFSIEDKKIIRKRSLMVDGLISPASLSLMKIIPIPLCPDRFAVCGNYFFMVELIEDDKCEPLRMKLIFNSMVPSRGFFMCMQCTFRWVLLIDLLGGLFKIRIDDINEHTLGHLDISEIPIKLRSTFITSFDILPDKRNEAIKIFIGDSLGNLCAIEYDCRKQSTLDLFYYNIGDQINILRTIEDPQYFSDRFTGTGKILEVKNLAIIGTVSGGIHCISCYDPNSSTFTNLNLQNCVKELVSFHLALNTACNLLELYNRWIFQKDVKTLSEELSGKENKVETFGIIDISFIQKWLRIETILDLRQPYYKRLAKNMRKNLPLCYRHKLKLTEIVSEAEVI